jgi:hypothetical protein
MQEALLLIGLFLVFGLFALFMIRANRRATARVREVWTEVAERLGGHFDPTSWTVDAVISDIEIRLDRYAVTTGQTTMLFSRMTAATASTKRLLVYRGGVFSKLAKSIGLQDHTVGDAAYDDTFIIQSDDQEWATSVLVDAFREEHLELSSVSLRIQDGKVTSQQMGNDVDVEALIQRFRLTAALALSAEQRALSED